MKKIIPLAGYVLITFEDEGTFRLPTDTLQDKKIGSVVDIDVQDAKSGILVGDKIHFTNITGSVVSIENKFFAFVSYKDIIGKEINE